MTYDPNFLFCNLSKLLHLRYLKLESAYSYDPLRVCQLPECLSKFYHLRVLDLTSWYGYGNLPKDINNLKNLRHFLVRDKHIHSQIACVGNLKFLQELRNFKVKTDNSFQLHQLGRLTELGGSLTINNLNEVKAKEDAIAAKLMYKSNIQKLALSWKQSHNEPTKPEEILESLQPHSNLQELNIEGYRGKTCPTWLNINHTFNQLKYLHLMNCTALEELPPLTFNQLKSLRLIDCKALKVLPLLGQLSSLKELELQCIPSLTEWGTQLFENTKREELPKLTKISLKGMPNLEKWVGGDTCSCFSLLEVLKIKNCPKLNELASMQCSSSGPEESTNWFPNLRELQIYNCPELMSLPPMPHTPTLSEVGIGGVKLGFDGWTYSKDLARSRLEVHGLDFWDEKVLSFHHLSDLLDLRIEKCPPPSYKALHRLTSLTSMRIEKCLKIYLEVEETKDEGAGGLLHMASNLARSLWNLIIVNCRKIRGLAVEELLQEEASYWATSSSTIAVGEIQDEGEEQVQEDLLHIPSNLVKSLQNLHIKNCPDLLCVGKAGLQGLVSLESLEIWGSSKLLPSSFPSSEICCFFPSSLQCLGLYCLENEILPSLSNLSSLTSLQMESCDQLETIDLRIQAAALQQLRISGCSSLASVEGLQSLTPHLKSLTITFCESLASVEGLQSILPHLKSLEVRKCPNLNLFAEPPSSLLLEELETEEPAVLTTQICNQLSSSLRQLKLWFLPQVKHFTKEQEAALLLLTSLQNLQFLFCENLHSLPTELHRLPSLQKLVIFGCPSISSLPKRGLPCSMQELIVSDCSKKLKPLRKLRRDNPNLTIYED